MGIQNASIIGFVLRFFLILPCVWAGFFLFSVEAMADEPQQHHTLRISRSDLAWIGEKMFHKECGGDQDKLLTWNAGESFASLGIGHFIWYPLGQNGPFEESFPAFIDFARKRGIRIPAWIETADEGGCPWTDRQSFYMARESDRMRSLEQFLIRTMPEQSLFIVNRLKDAFPKMMAAAPHHKKTHVRTQFFRVADSSMKLYALIDYVNFKGEGTRQSERYNNQGWGLLQVLEEMDGAVHRHEVLDEFSRAAETVLVRRVLNAPRERNEHRWLPGWKNRVKAYKNLHGTQEIQTSFNEPPQTRLPRSDS